MKVFTLLLTIVFCPAVSAQPVLTKLVKMAMDRSIDLPVYDSDIEAKSMSRLSSRLRLLPKLNLSVTHGDTFGIAVNTLQYSANVSWSNFNGLSEFSLWNRQTYAERLSRVNREILLLEIEREVATAFFDYMKNWQLLDAGQKNLQFTKDSMDIAKRLYTNGRVSRQELLRAEIELNLATINWQGQEQLLNDSTAKLFEWVGEYKIVGQWPFSRGDIKSKSVVRPGLTYLDHPRLRAANLKNSVENQTLNQAKSRFLPQAGFQLSRNYYPEYVDNQYESVALLTVRLPLFDSGEDYSAIKERRVELLRANSLLTKEKRNLYQRWQASKKNLDLSVKSLEYVEKTLQLASKMMKVSSIHYAKGIVDFNHYGQDLKRYLNAYTQQAQSLYSYHIQVLERCQVIGLEISKCITSTD